MYKHKRTYTRKGKYARRRRKFMGRVPRKQIGFPKSQTVKMRYVDQVTLDSNGLVLAQHSFSANSIFDPDVSGSGHQPLGRDEWFNFYDHYIVTSSSIRATFFPTSSAAVIPSVAGILLNDSGTPISGLNAYTLCEQGLSNYKIVSENQSTGKPTSISKSFNSKAFFNIGDIKDNFKTLGAGQNASPTEQAYFNIYSQPCDLTTDTGSYQVIVQIDYNVCFSEPKQLAQS